MKKIDKKIKISNKISPYFFGLSDDLLFWIAINTIFLTTVKHFTASQISLLTSIALFSSIILQNLVFKIIKKIGNIKSVRIGLIMLFIASFTITFGKTFIMVEIGYIFYYTAYLFKGMDTVILKNNLKYLGKEEDFIKIQSKGSTIYAIITMVIAFIAGLLFNINNYLPMLICISICIFNIFFSFFLYEAELPSKDSQNRLKYKWTKIIVYVILLYGLLFSLLDTSQENGKLFIQYFLQDFKTIEQTAIYLSLVVSLSRIVRVLADLLFVKIYDKIKNKILLILNLGLLLSITLLILGSLFKSSLLGLAIMTIGYCLILCVRDPLMNFLKNELLKNCRKEYQERAILNFGLCRNIITCIVSALASLILLKLDMLYLMITLLILALTFLYFVFKLYKMLEKRRK